MLSDLNVAIVKIPFRSKVMGFSNNRLFTPVFLLSWERGFLTGMQQWYWGAIDATPQVDDLW